MCAGISSLSSNTSNPPIYTVPAGMKSCVIPSVGDIFRVAVLGVDVGCDVGAGVDVDVDVTGIAVGARVFVGILVAGGVMAL